MVSLQTASSAQGPIRLICFPVDMEWISIITSPPNQMLSGDQRPPKGTWATVDTKRWILNLFNRFRSYQIPMVLGYHTTTGKLCTIPSHFSLRYPDIFYMRSLTPDSVGLCDEPAIATVQNLGCQCWWVELCCEVFGIVLGYLLQRCGIGWLWSWIDTYFSRASRSARKARSVILREALFVD